MRLLLALLTCLLGGSLAAMAHPMGPPPGKMVDIGGRHLHLNCKGKGQPTVLIDIGLGAASLEWSGVMQRVAAHQQVCVLERAGYGWSEMGPYPRTSAQQANDLYLLQLSADLKPPYVLVGHSYGGYSMQIFARRYPFLVAGLVLVDASHPEQAERFEAPPYGVQVAPSSRVGIVRFGDGPRLHPAMSEEARRQAMFQFENWRPRRTISWELLGFRDSEAELRAEPPLPKVPLIVLTRGKRVWPEGAHGDLLEKLWIDLQSELAQESPKVLHLVAPDAGHQLHLEAPEVVVYAIHVATDAWHLGAADHYQGPWLARSPAGRISRLRDTLGLPDSAGNVSSIPAAARPK